MHRLSNIDPQARTATCLVCGPTKIRIKNAARQGPGRYRCSTLAAVHDRLHQQRRPQGYSHPKYRLARGKVCSHCGFVPKHPCQLDAHHVDGNHKNDDPANLQTLCANCHRLVTVTGTLYYGAEVISETMSIKPATATKEVRPG